MLGWLLQPRDHGRHYTERGDAPRAAHRVLTCPRDSRHDDGRFLDLDLAALGNVVEAIVLFDDILVPDLGHSDLAALLQPFGPAIRIWSVSTAARKSIATQARRWMASWNNIDAFIRVLGASPLYANVGGGTFWYLVLEAVGARDRVCRVECHPVASINVELRSEICDRKANRRL